MSIPQLEKLGRQITVVGLFRDPEAAKLALRRIGGFPADNVGITSDVRQAREPAGSFSMTGALVGATVGVAVALVWTIWSWSSVLQNPVAALLGIPGFIVAGIAIGALAGRARVFQRREYARLENAAEAGGTLVTIVCDERDRARAERELHAAGASRVRVEDTPEAL